MGLSALSHLEWGSNSALACVVGVALLAYRGQYFWVAVTLLFFIFTPRHYQSVGIYTAAPLAAYGIYIMVSELIFRTRNYIHFKYPQMVHAIVLFFVSLGFGVTQIYAIGYKPSMQQVSPDALEAAEWAKQTFGPEARSVNLSSMPWYISREAEWWPYLTGHRNVNTVQGREWLGAEVWDDVIDLSDDLEWSADCSVWMKRLKELEDIDYIIIHENTVCLDHDPSFTPAFVRDDVSIYTRS